MQRGERIELDTLIQLNEAKSWWTPELFERDIRPRFPQKLSIIKPPPAAETNYNCFIYSLGLSADKEIIHDSKGFIYSAFVAELIAKGILSKTDSPNVGDLVFYQDLENYPKEITHSGVLQSDGAIISKWAWGPLVRHALTDVPESYGNTIWYTNPIKAQDARRWYWEFRAFNRLHV